MPAASDPLFPINVLPPLRTVAVRRIRTLDDKRELSDSQPDEALTYALLFEHWPELVDPAIDATRALYNRYFWFACYVALSEMWNGPDAGLEQQLTQILETSALELDVEILEQLEARARSGDVPREPAMITRFALPPGRPDAALVRRVFATLDEISWLPSTSDLVDENVEHWTTQGSVTVEGDGIEVAFRPNREAERNTIGSLVVKMERALTTVEDWRERHAEGMATLAKLLASPVAQAGLEETFALNLRLVDHNGVSVGVPRLAGYHEGLVTLAWRNVFGPSFTKLFGERLSSLPEGIARDLGDGYWFVESPPGREAEIIEHLGKDVFYDMEHETKPTRRPVIEGPLDSPPTEALAPAIAPRPAPGEYFLLYRSASGFSFERARDILAAAGFVILREGNGFSAHVDGPELHVHPADVAAVREEIMRRATPDKVTAAALAACDAALSVSVDNLDEALDEANTLIESQMQLGDASSGYLFIGWNDALQAPE